MMQLEGQHLSLDIETLGTTPGDAIISIGAIGFDAHGILPFYFYREISVGDNQKHGLTIDNGTLAWWLTQPDGARKTVTNTLNGGAELGETIDDLGLWIRQRVPNVQGVWTNGPAFDSAFIKVAAKRTGRKDPWHYSLDRDFRTIRDLSGLSWSDVETTGDAHNALADATNQASYIVKAFERMQAWAAFPPKREPHPITDLI
jgi:hypothetical protein